MKTMPDLLENFCECAQNQPAKQILPKIIPNNCDVQVFERVDEAMKNESLNVLSLTGNAKLFGDSKVFLAKNTKNRETQTFPLKSLILKLHKQRKATLHF